MFFKTMLIALLLLSSCFKDDIKDQIIEPEMVQSSRLQTNCTIKEGSFSDFNQRILTEEINCISRSLKIFADVVKTDQPGSLPLKNLKEYIVNNQPQDQDLFETLDVMFEFAQVMLGGRFGYIDSNHIDLLVDFLKVLNQEMVLISPFYTEDKTISSDTFRLRQKQLTTSSLKIANAFKSLSLNSHQEPSRLNINRLLDLIFEDSPTIRKAFEVFIFVKRPLLGGDNQYLTSLEAEMLVEKIPQILNIVFMVKSYDNIAFADEMTKYQVWQDIHDQIQSALNPSAQNTPLFKTSDLMKVASFFAEDIGFDIANYPKEFAEFKHILMGQAGEVIDRSQLQQVLNHINELAQMGRVFSGSFKYFEKSLSSKNALMARRLEGQIWRSSKEKELFDSFKRIVTNYRFFRDRSGIALFSHEYHRNLYGVFEIGMMEYILTVVAKYYEKKYPCDNELIFTPDQRCTDPSKRERVFVAEDYNATLTQHQIERMFRDFSKILVTEGFFAKDRESNYAENTTLMSTLFMFQSKGGETGGLMHIPELTEFGLAALSGFSAGANLFDRLSTQCAQDHRERLEPNCVRKNLFNSMKKTIVLNDDPLDLVTVNYSQKLKLLFDYINELRANNDLRSELLYFKEAELISRTCVYYGFNEPEKGEVWISKGDIGSSLAGLLFIESTIIRWDANRSNFMEEQEIELAFRSRFRPAIEALVAPVYGIADNVYQYLIATGNSINVEDFESSWKMLMKMAQNPLGRFRYSADRKRIAQILKIIGLVSPAAMLNPYDCDAMR